MKHIVAGILLVACSSPDLDMEFGQADEDFVSQATNTGGADLLTGVTFVSGNPVRCSDTTTTTCVVPGRDSIRWSAIGLPGTFSGAANALNSEIEGTPRFVNVTGTADLTAGKGGVGNFGADNINTYLRVTCNTEATALTESLPGIFKRWTDCACTLDTDKMALRAANAVERTNLQQHAYKQCLLVVAGVGQQSTTNGLASSISILPLNASTANFTSGERCRTTNYQAAASAGSYVRATFSGCANN